MINDGTSNIPKQAETHKNSMSQLQSQRMRQQSEIINSLGISERQSEDPSEIATQSNCVTIRLEDGKCDQSIQFHPYFEKTIDAQDEGRHNPLEEPKNSIKASESAIERYSQKRSDRVRTNSVNKSNREEN